LTDLAVVHFYKLINFFPLWDFFKLHNLFHYYFPLRLLDLNYFFPIFFKYIFLNNLILWLCLLLFNFLNYLFVLFLFFTYNSFFYNFLLLLLVRKLLLSDQGIITLCTLDLFWGILLILCPHIFQNMIYINITLSQIHKLYNLLLSLIQIFQIIRILLLYYFCFLVFKRKSLFQWIYLTFIIICNLVLEVFDLLLELIFFTADQIYQILIFIGLALSWDVQLLNVVLNIPWLLLGGWHLLYFHFIFFLLLLLLNDLLLI
jgi:hypothetical protein